MAEVESYYRDQRQLFEEIAAGSRVYNLGWTPPEFHGNFTDAQRELVFLVVDTLGLKHGSRVLDIGCGQGGPARMTAKRYGTEVIGVELLAGQLARRDTDQHPRETGRARFVRGDAQRLPLADASFDGAYSLESAFHYPDKAAFIHEASRVLRPGAHLAVADIVMEGKGGKGLIHAGFKLALAAPELFTTERYHQAGLSAGLRPRHAFDLTPGVMRSLHLAGHLITPRIRKLSAQGYPLPFLLAVWTAFFHLRYTHPLIPVRYRLFVFEKS